MWSVVDPPARREPDEVDLEGDQSATDYENAREVLDWEPEHSWREAEDEQVDGPSFV